MGWKDRQAARVRLGLEGNKKKEKKDEYQVNPYNFDSTTRYTIKCVVKETYVSRKGFSMWKIYFLLGDEKGLVFYDRPWSPTYSFRIGQHYEVNLINGKPFLEIKNIVNVQPKKETVSQHKRALFRADLEVICEELSMPTVRQEVQQATGA